MKVFAASVLSKELSVLLCRARRLFQRHYLRLLLTWPFPLVRLAKFGSDGRTRSLSSAEWTALLSFAPDAFETRFGSVMRKRGFQFFEEQQQNFYLCDLFCIAKQVIMFSVECEMYGR